MPPEVMFDVSTVDDGRILYDLNKIKEINPQRFEMEQLTAIVHMDTAQNLIVGYKGDVTDSEFWVRGHIARFSLNAGRDHVRSGCSAHRSVCQEESSGGWQFHRFFGHGCCPLSRPGQAG